MISKPKQISVVPPRNKVASDRLDLADFDGQRMSVVLDLESGRIVIRGTARFVRDDAIGNTLNIQPDDDEPGHPVIVISENDWGGRIIPDFHYGCQFSLIIS